MSGVPLRNARRDEEKATGRCHDRQCAFLAAERVFPHRERNVRAAVERRGALPSTRGSMPADLAPHRPPEPLTQIGNLGIRAPALGVLGGRAAAPWYTPGCALGSIAGSLAPGR